MLRREKIPYSLAGRQRLLQVPWLLRRLLDMVLFYIMKKIDARILCTDLYNIHKYHFWMKFEISEKCTFKDKMPARLSYDEVKEYIHGKGYELLSKEYTHSKNRLDIKCAICHKEYKQTFTHFKMGYLHPYCGNVEGSSPIKKPFGGYKKPVTLVPISCLVCKKVFQPKRSSSKLCSIICSNKRCTIPEYLERAKLNCKKAGQISAASQSRRSKNEIYFSELCKQYFEITTNEPFFNGWDADIIIHSEKISILWNGAWHYKQISKKQSLLQVQTRDKIKMDVIEKMGYTPYIIKDMGKYNRKFVEQEFETFMLMRLEY
jgi:hypothetical protein